VGNGTDRQEELSSLINMKRVVCVCAADWLRAWSLQAARNATCMLVLLLPQVVSVLEDFTNRRAANRSRSDYIDQVCCLV
jgi:hypothetical protein